MDGPEVLIPLAFFAFLAAVIIVPIVLRERTKRSAQDLMRQALERGEKLDPELLSRLTGASNLAPAPDRARRSLGSALIMVGLAAGLAVASYFQGDWDPSRHSFGGMMTGAAILGCLGIAFTILAIVDYASKPKNPPQA